MTENYCGVELDDGTICGKVAHNYVPFQFTAPYIATVDDDDPPESELKKFWVCPEHAEEFKDEGVV